MSCVQGERYLMTPHIYFSSKVSTLRGYLFVNLFFQDLQSRGRSTRLSTIRLLEEPSTRIRDGLDTSDSY